MVESKASHMACRHQVLDDEQIETDVHDFVMLGDSTCLQPHNKYEERKVESDGQRAGEAKDLVSPQMDCKVQIHRVEDDGMIIKVVPPSGPAPKQRRAPVEIVLLIDVSISMDDLAPVPSSGDGEEPEQKGFTVLDLTKHAACTVAASLNDDDTLCIVTFSTKCKVLLQRLPMTTKNKELAKELILSMQPEESTYLWSGIRVALDQLSDDLDKTRALMVLTDGCPNEPLSNGVVAALRRWCKDKCMDRMPVPIHTFGFGYGLKKGLLHSIAEVGGGDYCFVPDASMLGTVFNHAVANLMSVYAQTASLTVTYPNVLRLTQPGAYINEENAVEVFHTREGPFMKHSIDLKSIQYGQSRDLFVRFGWRPDVRANVLGTKNRVPNIRATLQYRQRAEERLSVAQSNLLVDTITLTPAETAFHISRAMIVDFLCSLFPRTERGEYEPLLNDNVPTYDCLQRFLAQLPANNFLDDPFNLGLLQDLAGAGNKNGEIELALRNVVEPKKKKSNWETWGRHYLPSLLMAHRLQKCISFKDPGTQCYGKGSQLFRDQLYMLDGLFDSLPPSQPSKAPGLPSYDAVVHGPINPPSPPSNMSRYRNVESTCFAGHTRVLVVNLNDGTKGTVPIDKLRTGDTVKTLTGKNKKVQNMLKCHTHPARGRTMIVVPNNTAGLWVTPWHPMSLDQGATWVFPAEAYPDEEYPQMVKTGFNEPVYTVQLERQAGDVADDHTINVEGLWAATMGHGLTTKSAAGRVDVRVHDFYGDWDAVAKSLDKLPTDGGMKLGDGTVKDDGTGLSIGFLPFQGVDIYK